jgi:hypothetical protein
MATTNVVITHRRARFSKLEQGLVPSAFEARADETTFVGEGDTPAEAQGDLEAVLAQLGYKVVRCEVRA